jgi:hypothetical protein
MSAIKNNLARPPVSSRFNRRQLLQGGAAMLGGLVFTNPNQAVQAMNAAQQDSSTSVEADAQKFTNITAPVTNARNSYVSQRTKLQAEMLNSDEFINGMKVDQKHGLPIFSQREFKVFSEYSRLDRDLKQTYLNAAKTTSPKLEEFLAGLNEERKEEVFSFLANKQAEQLITQKPELAAQKDQLIKQLSESLRTTAKDYKDLASMRLAEGDFDRVFTKHNVITGKDGKHFSPFVFLYSSKDTTTIKPGDVGKRLNLVQNENDPNLSGLRQNAYRYTVEKTNNPEKPFAISTRFNYHASEVITEDQNTRSFKFGYQHGDSPHTNEVNIVSPDFNKFKEVPHQETHFKSEGPNGPTYNKTNTSVSIFLLPKEGYGAGFYDVEK